MREQERKPTMAALVAQLPELRIGTLLAQARKDRGYSQERLATLLDVDKSTVSHWETGKTYPNIVTWALLIDILEAPWLADVRNLPL